MRNRHVTRRYIGSAGPPHGTRHHHRTLLVVAERGGGPRGKTTRGALRIRCVRRARVATGRYTRFGLEDPTSERKVRWVVAIRSG